MVCAVHGYCFTIGIELLLACDVALAATSTQFAQMEVQRGIMPFGGATLRFPTIAGWGNAMRYLLTGEEFSAEEAYRIGIVQEVVEPEMLQERALELAQRVAAQAPLAVRQTRMASRIARELADRIRPSRRVLLKAERFVSLMLTGQKLRKGIDTRIPSLWTGRPIP